MIYIFDIDGTLADIEHRRHFVSGERQDWKSFNESMIVDEPFPQMVQIVKSLYMSDSRPTVLLASGRGEEYRLHTEEWLTDDGIGYDHLYMRPAYDYRSDVIIKREILTQIREEHGEPDMVFDDRKSVVDMWIEEGIFVADVGQGKGNF